MSTTPAGPFLVEAYRWGWLNNHKYVLGLTNDWEKAVALARAEADCRGGKYGVAVWGVRDGATECADVVVRHYEPSQYGEKALHFNHRMDAFERIGNKVVWRTETPTKGEETPSWLKDIVDGEMSMSEMFGKMQKQLNHA